MRLSITSTGRQARIAKVRLCARVNTDRPDLRKNIIKAMNEMVDSGLIESRKDGRFTVYRIDPQPWKHLLMGANVHLRWIDWLTLFGACERITSVLETIDTNEPDIAQASALRRVLEDGVIESLEKAGIYWRFGPLEAYPGEALIPQFVARMDAFLAVLK
ncbi:MAG: hypothetical protein ACI97B_002490 [Verrucomicrobiales bacterium]|jgi:hypothetical protein